MKERPILFNALMVRAILDGRKTQTRRVVNGVALSWLNDDFTPQFVADYRNGLSSYGQVGDRLWVREEHYRFGHWEPVPGVKTKTGRIKWRFVADTKEVIYEQPVSYRKGRHHKDPATPAWHKRLARFMPRIASRINLEITGVRVELLQDISEGDAISEGIQWSELSEITRWCRPPRVVYQELWESIYGTESWDPNLWVWVIEFKRVMP